MAQADERLYRVSFLNQGQLYEIYALHVSQGGFFGFIEVEELLFGERSRLVVDPSEERLRTEFEGVRRMFIPMHSVVRVDEVEKQGSGRIRTGEVGSSKVTPFPMIIAPSTDTPSR